MTLNWNKGFDAMALASEECSEHDCPSFLKRCPKCGNWITPDIGTVSEYHCYNCKLKLKKK